jgi:nicotinamide mononucleotide transporter
MSFFNVDSVFFSVLGYPLSYIELAATLLIVIYVLLITKKIVWAWPLGLIAFSLFAVLFYQIRLYSDFFEQFYYIGNCFYGWWVWLAMKKKSAKSDEPDVTRCIMKTWFLIASIIAVGGGLAGFTMSRIHIWLPALFPNPAAYPYIDATATVTGFVAAGLMTHKKIEAWFLWICVNSICIWLYFSLNVKFVAVLYIFFLALSLNGLLTWSRDLRKSNQAL